MGMHDRKENEKTLNVFIVVGIITPLQCFMEDKRNIPRATENIP